jgi:ferredoxin-NADP reductase
VQFESHVKRIIQQTYNVKSFQFDQPLGFEYKPGQFFFITIKIKGVETRKHFTISSDPSQVGVLEFTKKLTGHEFSNALDELKPRDWVRIDGAHGNFTFKGEFEKLAMLTGGIGITPLRSMISYCNSKKTMSDIVLLYSNRSEEDIVFRKELEKINAENSNIKVVFTLTHTDKNWPGYSRRIDKEMILKEIPDFKERVFFTCGPPKLVNSMIILLEEMKVEQSKINFEHFPGY